MAVVGKLRTFDERLTIVAYDVSHLKFSIKICLKYILMYFLSKLHSSVIFLFLRFEKWRTKRNMKPFALKQS